MKVKKEFKFLLCYGEENHKGFYFKDKRSGMNFLRKLGINKRKGCFYLFSSLLWAVLYIFAKKRVKLLLEVFKRVVINSTPSKPLSPKIGLFVAK